MSAPVVAALGGRIEVVPSHRGEVEVTLLAGALTVQTFRLSIGSAHTLAEQLREAAEEAEQEAANGPA